MACRSGPAISSRKLWTLGTLTLGDTMAAPGSSTDGVRSPEPDEGISEGWENFLRSAPGYVSWFNSRFSDPKDATIAPVERAPIETAGCRTNCLRAIDVTFSDETLRTRSAVHKTTLFIILSFFAGCSTTIKNAQVSIFDEHSRAKIGQIGVAGDLELEHIVSLPGLGLIREIDGQCSIWAAPGYGIVSSLFANHCSISRTAAQICFHSVFFRDRSSNGLLVDGCAPRTKVDSQILRNEDGFRVGPYLCATRKDLGFEICPDPTPTDVSLLKAWFEAAR